MESIKLSREASISFIKLLGGAPPEATQELIELLKCGVTNYKNQFLCSYTPDPRMMKLEDMTVDYYKGITDEMSEKERILHSKEFRRWCKDGGYTQREVNAVMQAALCRNDI